MGSTVFIFYFFFFVFTCEKNTLFFVGLVGKSFRENLLEVVENSWSHGSSRLDLFFLQDQPCFQPTIVRY